MEFIVTPNDGTTGTPYSQTAPVYSWRASLTEARDAAKIVERLEDLGGVLFINEREVEGWQKCGCGSKLRT